MAITSDDIQAILNAIREQSVDLKTLETVATLDGVNSLPAVRGEQPVTVPISLIASGVTSVLAFDGIVSGVDVLDVATADPDAVVYDNVRGRFLGCTRRGLSPPYVVLYYKSWNVVADKGILYPDRYGNVADDGVVPVAGKIYVNTKDTGLYAWENGVLSLMMDDIQPLTDEEINNMFN